MYGDVNTTWMELMIGHVSPGTYSNDALIPSPSLGKLVAFGPFLTVWQELNQLTQPLFLNPPKSALFSSLLRHFPNAIAVCQDGSEEMAELGHKRMMEFNGRFSYLLSDLSRRGWSSTINEQFEAVVSSIAIHNLRASDTIQAVYKEIFPLVKPGGYHRCFD